MREEGFVLSAKGPVKEGGRGPEDPKRKPPPPHPLGSTPGPRFPAGGPLPPFRPLSLGAGLRQATDEEMKAQGLDPAKDERPPVIDEATLPPELADLKGGTYISARPVVAGAPIHQLDPNEVGDGVESLFDGDFMRRPTPTFHTQPSGLDLSAVAEGARAGFDLFMEAGFTRDEALTLVGKLIESKRI